MAHTFVRCQGGSYPEDDCRIVAYASHGPAVSSVAGTSIKLEPPDEAAPELPERAEGVRSAGLPDGYMAHEGVGGGALAPKRGAASVGGGSGVQKRAKCEHGRKKYDCKECGGGGICPHGRIKRTCKDCGGNGICSHGRQKSRCKECGGSSICSHGREKYT